MYDIHRRRGRTKRDRGDLVTRRQGIVSRQACGPSGVEVVMVAARRPDRTSEADTVQAHEASTETEIQADQDTQEDSKHVPRDLEPRSMSDPSRRCGVTWIDQILDGQRRIQHLSFYEHSKFSQKYNTCGDNSLSFILVKTLTSWSGGKH